MADDEQIIYVSQSDLLNVESLENVTIQYSEEPVESQDSSNDYVSSPNNVYYTPPTPNVEDIPQQQLRKLLEEFELPSAYDAFFGKFLTSILIILFTGLQK